MVQLQIYPMLNLFRRLGIGKSPDMSGSFRVSLVIEEIPAQF